MCRRGSRWWRLCENIKMWIVREWTVKIVWKHRNVNSEGVDCEDWETPQLCRVSTVLRKQTGWPWHCLQRWQRASGRWAGQTRTTPAMTSATVKKWKLRKKGRKMKNWNMKTTAGKWWSEKCCCTHQEPTSILHHFSLFFVFSLSFLLASCVLHWCRSLSVWSVLRWPCAVDNIEFRNRRSLSSPVLFPTSLVFVVVGAGEGKVGGGGGGLQPT